MTQSEEFLRIADFSTHLSGPMTSQLLRGFGADVIKFENPRDGDGNRPFPPLIDGVGMFHLTLNAGTRSMAIDRRSPQWREVVDAAVRWADVVVVGGRPTDVERIGLGFDDLTAANPDVIYCLVTGYGNTGPWRDYPAHGQQPDAMAGLVPIVWRDGLPETPPGWRSAGTTLVAMFSALGIMAAVRQQAIAPGPKYVTSSIWGSALWWNWRDLNTQAGLGTAWPDYGDLGSRYAMYPTADDRVLILCPIERKFWEPFCDLLGLPPEVRSRGDWSTSRMDFGRGAAYDGERELIAAATRRRPLAEWIPGLEEVAVPFAPVLTWQEAMTGEHAQANAVMRPMPVADRMTSIAAVPVSVTSRPEEPDTSPLPPAPALGADTAAVMEQLDLAQSA